MFLFVLNIFSCEREVDYTLAYLKQYLLLSIC